jgi:hypothetical protein
MGLGNPAFIRLAGANFGFQIGVQSTDVVLVLMSRESVEGIAAQGHARCRCQRRRRAARPVGAATTDATLSAQILSIPAARACLLASPWRHRHFVDTGANETAWDFERLPRRSRKTRFPRRRQMHRRSRFANRATTRTAVAPAAQLAVPAHRLRLYPAPAPGTAPLPPPSPLARRKPIRWKTRIRGGAARRMAECAPAS